MKKTNKSYWKYFLLGIVFGVLCFYANGMDDTVPIWIPIGFFALPLVAFIALVIYSIFSKKWKILLSFSVGLFGCIFLVIFAVWSYSEFQYRIVGRITPHPDSTSPTGVYIPKDIKECHLELDKSLSFFLKREMKNCDNNEMVKYHFSVGLWIRNSWGLWGDSRLTEYMKSLGYTHPDDMSSAILDSYWCHLHNCDFDLTEDIKYYKQWWQNQVKMINEPRPSVCRDIVKCCV